MPSCDKLGGGDDNIGRSPSSSTPTLQNREPTRRQQQQQQDEKCPPRIPVPVPCSETPITYRYLGFDSVLPPRAYPPALEPSDADDTRRDPGPGPGLPPPPNLHRYSSPLHWPSSRKHLLLFISCVATFLTAYSAGSYSPPTPAMASDLGASHLATLAGISTFCLGFALAPMALAPVSEMYGRRPVLVVSGLVYVVFQAVCSVMTNVEGMLVARLFVGIGGSTFSSVIGGVIADLWSKSERNTPMALFSGSVLAGTGAGPLVASVIMARLGAAEGRTLAWKWVFWHQVIVDSALLVGMVFFLRESRGAVLLSRKARLLNRWYERLEEKGVYGVWLDESLADEARAAAPTDAVDAAAVAVPLEAIQQPLEMDEEKGGRFSSSSATSPVAATAAAATTVRAVRLRWLVKEDEERASLAQLVKTSLVRPFHLLFAEPVVFFFSLWCAFAWAVLFLTFGSIPLALQRRRGMDMEESGRFFAAMIVGSIVATVVGICQDYLLRLPQWQTHGQDKDQDGQVEQSSNNSSNSSSSSPFWTFVRRRFPASSPESRLYFTCLTSTLLPAGLFLFGFTARPEAHWIFPAAGIALATWGIFSVYLATFNYFADIYHAYASSALAAQSFCRNVLGGVFPLVTGALFGNLGEERAGALLGGIAAALTAIPWCLVFFGQRIRARSKFAISLDS